MSPDEDPFTSYFGIATCNRTSKGKYVHSDNVKQAHVGRFWFRNHSDTDAMQPLPTSSCRNTRACFPVNIDMSKYFQRNISSDVIAYTFTEIQGNVLSHENISKIFAAA